MEKRPNILVLMTDQQRADCLGCAGHPHVRTPNLDRLAAEGTRFANFHTTCPICMPARSSFLSGLYCHNHGQWENLGCLPLATDTYARRLRAAGYRTAHVGKSHLYPHGEGCDLRRAVPYMNALGFDDVLETTGPWATLKAESILTEHWRALGLLERFRDDYRKRREHRRNSGREALWPSPMPEGEALDDFIGRTAVEYLAGYDRRQPFCVFVGFGGPHEPWDPPPSWAEMYGSIMPQEPLPRAAVPPWLSEPARDYARRIGGRDFAADEWRAVRRLYYAKISHVDAWVGRILDTLAKRGLLDETFILFWSDHGERLCDRGGLFKGVFYDEVVRVPLILRRPDGIGAGKVATTLCETTDLKPTLLAAAGLEVEGCFGAPLLPCMEHPTMAVHEAVFSEIEHAGRRATMVRTGRYKMVLDEQANTLQLFDLAADPAEVLNLAGREDARPVEAQLRERILAWRLRTETVQQRTPGPAASA